MNKALNSLRLFLFTCSGEDNYILKRCKSTIQRRFALIGFFVLLIFVGCFFSATLFSYSLFQGSECVSMSIGLLWGAMVVIMYLLLLHTISPAIIPLASKKKRRKDNAFYNESEEKAGFLSLSMFLRIAFMMLLAMIIAQPLNFSALSSTVETQLEKHKIQERVKLYSLTNKHLIEAEVINQREFNNKVNTQLSINHAQNVSSYLSAITAKIDTDRIFLQESTKKLNQLNNIDNHVFLNRNENQKKKLIIDKLETLLDNQITSDESFVQNLKSITISGTLKSDFDNYKSKLEGLVIEKISNYNNLNRLLDKSNFYIKTLQLLLIENPVSWLITVIVCLAFLLPIGLKYYARDISAKMFLEINKENHELIKLRAELISTTDFDWLEKKIKTINARDIRTSDYYFQRMLIEHRIILEEYDDAKKQFSGILTENIRKFNGNSMNRLLPLLEKLKKVNLSKHHYLTSKILEEYKNEIVIKYEYWLDCPFRTKRTQNVSIKNTEVGLLDFVYNQPENDENL
ncbi:DUF4407 domain-containing protein [Flavobacterium sp. UBA7682]|uniref:DUF4407 domain-containing protein n=1 Tax=Flavobacterium sp. UBA7682 TaxID=1946560 RepID=UPI0025B8E607|nr:DUF4407 domain-containing protein [Flavobacterium sp. UBA7682]